MLPKKKIMIATGGTGGHVFPACALGEQLMKFSDEVDFLFAGGKLKENPYFSTFNFPFASINCGLNTKSSIRNLLAKGIDTFKGVWESYRLLKEYKPDLVVGFGSYYTLPILLAAKLNKIPIVLHESNYIPGKITRSFSRFSKITGVQFPATTSLIKGKTLEVGVPLREGYTSTFKAPEKAREYFGLHSDKLTLLVFGGSQGALTLNSEMMSAVLALAERTKNFQVIHLTGKNCMEKELKDFYKEIGILAYVNPFEERMDLAWGAADLAVTRSGALTIAEAIAFEIPSILIPYPYATDDHQEKNARYFLEKVQGGELLVQSKELAENIVKVIVNWLEDDRKEWKKYKNNIKKFKLNQPKRDLCSLVCEVVKVKVR